MNTLSTTPDGVVRQLRKYLETADLSRCQAKVVADHFGVNRSTIDKRLCQTDTSWQALKNAERGRRLDKLMAEGRASRENGAKVLGFSQVAFQRFFLRHTGITLDRYYRQRRAA